MGGPGSGPRKLQSTTLKEAISNLEGDIPSIIEELKRLAYGKPVICECGREVGLRQIDREAAIYLIDRVLGKPTQRTEVDVTERIELTPLQIERIIERYQIAEIAMQSPPKQLLPMQLLPSKGSVKSVKD